MRGLTLTALLMLVTPVMALASQPIAKVQLPCESHDQTLSPTGSQLLVMCADHSLHLVSVPDGKHRELLPPRRRASASVFSQDGRWLALGFSDGSVQLVSSDDTAAVQEWKASVRRIDLLYFLPNAKALVVAPVDSPGEVWELTRTPTLRASLPVDFGGIAATAASPDGKILVTAAGDTVLRWYDTSTWQKTKEYRDFLLDTFALQFTPDGKQLLAAGADSRITVLDPATARQLRQLPPEAGAFIGSLDLLRNGHKVVALYFDDAGEKPPHALIWDLTTDKSAPVRFDSIPTCGDVVKGELWLCSTEGKTLTITQQE
jgi:WD40 repeat protein